MGINETAVDDDLANIVVVAGNDAASRPTSAAVIRNFMSL